MNIAGLMIAGISTFQIIDLTHTIDENTQVWDGSCGFSYKLNYDYPDGGFRGQQYTMRSCLGTHLDSPAHCFEGAADCSTMELKNAVVPAYVIDVTAKVHEDYGICLDDINEFESRYEKIKAGSLVFFNTGWSKHWHDPILFRNEKNGIPHFPFVTKEVIQLLLERDVVGIGIDTLSPDPFTSNDFPAHKLILGAGKYIIENVANLGSMPAMNCYVIALPLKIRGGVESPIRLIGLMPV